MSNWKKHYFYRFTAEILIILMVFQGVPLLELSKSFQWSPPRYIDFFKQMVSFVTPAEALAQSATPEVGTIFGPKKYVRTTGKPNIYIDDFTIPGESTTATLVIINDDDLDKHRITSAVIRLNGEQLFAPRDFNQKVARLEIPVNLVKSNTLYVELRSKPEGYITIHLEGHIPEAHDQTITTEEDTSVDIVLTGSDVDGDQLTFAVAAAPNHGDLSGVPPTITYTPHADYNGIDSFDFIANDGALDSQPATVTVTVTPVNDLPQANDDEAFLDEDTDTIINVLDNDFDVDGDPLIVTEISQPSKGTAKLNPDNTVLYTPAPDFNGNDSFTYMVSDGNGGTAVASVAITVNPVNDPPVADAGPDQTLSLPAGQTSMEVTLDGTGSSDKDSAIASYNWIGASAGAPDPADVPQPTVLLTAGKYIFTLVVSDVEGAGSQPSSVVIVIETPQIPPEITSDPVINGAVDKPYIYDVEAYDANGDTFTYSLVTAPEGMVIDPVTGLIQWTPTNAQVGSHAVTVMVTDSGGLSASQNFAVTVDDVNNAPIITSSPVTSATAGQLYTYDVEATDPDTGDVLTFSLNVSPSGMTIDPTTGLINWTPVAADEGNQQVEVKVSDGRGGEARDSFTISIELWDLKIEDVQGGCLRYDGQALTVVGSISANIINTGHFDIDAPIDVVFFEDTNYDGAFNAAEDNVLGQTVVPSPLQQGKSAIVWADIAGSVRFNRNIIYAITDPTNIVAEVDETNNIAQTGEGCRYFAGTIDPVLEWSKQTFSVAAAANKVLMTPVVADLNNDGASDIIFNTWYYSYQLGINTSALRAISGNGGEELWSVTDPNLVNTQDTGLAVGDIDADGHPEIIAVYGYAPGPSTVLTAFEHDGSLKWKSEGKLVLPDEERIDGGTPSIADLDHDGIPEIIFGAKVFNADGTFRWSGHDAGGIGRGSAYFGPLSIVADLDLDGNPEVVAGKSAYHADGTLYWNASIPDGFPAVGNFDNDPFPEIVVVDSPNVYLLEHTGIVKWGPVPIAGITTVSYAYAGGPPVVADLDGDTWPEIGVAGASKYTVFESDGSIKWTADINDRGSGMAGASVYDLDGDGAIEVIYGDQTTLWIFRGADGAVLFKFPKSSDTVYEYPIVADIDGDGGAEIIAPAGNYYYGPQTGIFVFGSASGNWTETRGVWNQHAYHITNVTDTSGIPAFEENSWQRECLYRGNVSNIPEADSSPAPNLTVSYLRKVVTNSETTYTVRIGNGGAQSAPAGISVALFDGDPHGDVVNIGGSTTSNELAPGQFEDVSIAFPLGTFPDEPSARMRWVWVDTDQALYESNEIDNYYQGEINQPPVINSSPVITSIPNTTGTAGAFYEYDVEATDPDADAVLTCSLVTAPSGMTIDPATGLIAWTPTLVQVGNHDVTVRVTDQGGLFAEQDFVVAVTAAPANHTPVITSTPTLAAAVGQTYRYQVVATDPDDGDTLTYSLPIAPVGMSIDPPGGLVQFTPTADQLGTLNVTVQATDRGGLSTKQSYVVIVSDTTIGNRAPVAVPGLIGEPGLPACVAPPGGMTSWFMGDSSFDDIVGISSPAIIIGSPQLVMGKVGQGIKFDGSSGLIVPNNPTIKFDADDSFTIDAWLRLDGVTFNSAVSIVDVRSGTNYGYGIFAYVYPFAPEGMVKFGAGIIAGTGVYAWARPVPMGEYHHVAAVVNRVKRTLAVYLDGLLEQELSIANVGFADARMYIGYPNRDVPTNQGSFNGMIDELEIFNRAISQAEIQSLYLAGSAGKCKLKNGDTVTLDGTGSSDADGDPLTYRWLLLAKPEGSAAALSDLTAVQPTFVADLAGVYRVQLIVSDGQADSSPSEITLQLSDGNLPPMALDDDYSVRLGNTLDLPAPGVIRNDYEPNGTPLSAVKVADPSYGTLNLSADGAFSYTPVTDVFGPGAKAHTKIGTAYMPGQPKNIAINTWTNRIYVTDLLIDRLEVIDGASGKVIDVLPAIGSYIEDVACNPATNRIYVTGPRINQYIEVPMVIFNGVHVYDGITHALLAMVPVNGNQVEDVAVNPATDRIYVASLDGDSVAVINGQTNAVIANIPVGIDPRQLAVDIQSNRIFALSTVDGTVTLIDGAANDVIATLAVGADPRFLLVDEELGRLFVTSFADASVAVIDQATHTVIKNIPVGNGPRGMTLDPTTGSLFVANSGDGSVTVIDRDTLAVVRTIAVGAGPESLAVNPLNNTLYVANTAADTLSVVDAATGAVSATVSVGHNPATLSVNPVTDRVYTVDTGSHTVSVVHVGDHFAYKVNDGEVDSNNATVTIAIEPQNPAPVALDDYYQAVMDGTLTNPAPGLLGNDVTFSGGTLAAELVSGPDSGSLTLNSDGSFAYTPVAGFIGTVTFIYKVNDGNLDSQVAHVTISVVADGNHPPVITSAAGAEALVGNLYTYDVEANDPDNDSLTFSLVAAPSGMTIDPASGLITWTPDTTQAGNQEVNVQVADPGGLTATQNFTIAVALTAEPFTAIVVDPADARLLTGQSQTFTATGIRADGTGKTLSSEVTWSSSNTAVATVSAGGLASALAPGTTEIRATAEGITGKATLIVESAVTDTTPPTAGITSPGNDSTLTGPTVVRGTATDANFFKYVLDIAPVGETNFTTIATGTTSVTDGDLGTLDTTLLLNDLYTLRLRVYDRANNRTSTSVLIQVSGEQKVGNFTLAFQDVTIPMACMPITVTRVYDSRDKAKGDFGVGWRLDVNTMRIRESGPQGTGWTIDLVNVPGPFGILIPTYLLYDTTVHKMSLSLPGGQVEEFDLTPQPSSSQYYPIYEVSASYTPRPGTVGSLAAGGVGTLMPTDETGDVELLDVNNETIFSPSTFRYTTPEGNVFIIDKWEGLQEVQCANGPKLVFTPEGITHSDGAGLTFTRDAEGRIIAITDPNGNVYFYEYDENGDLASYTDAEGNSTDFSYNYHHGLLEVIDPRGVLAIRNEYDEDGRLISTTDAAGNLVEFTHDLAARSETVTDRLGNQTVYEYDARGNVISQTDALGNVTSHTYDAFDNELTTTDALGNTTTREYDLRHNVLAETNPLGHTTKYTYTSLNAVKTITDPLGRITSNTYDTMGSLRSTSDPLGNATSWKYYDGPFPSLYYRPLPDSMTDALGNTTSYTYDGQGKLLEESDPLSNIVIYTYDANGNRLSETRTQTTDSGLETLATEYEYDAMNRLVKTTQPDGAITETVYNAIGKQAETIDALGRVTTYEYDERGNLVSTTYPDGTSDTSSYDAEGRRITSADRAGRVTSYTYDALGRLVQTTFPDETVTSSTYDAAGRVIATIDARGNATQYEYDAAGRRTKVIDPLGNATTFVYDKAGNQIQMNDANGNIMRFEYDANNRRIKTIHPDNTFDLMGHDALGRTVSKTDQAGINTQYGYDALGRLVTVTDALGQVTSYGYDEAGHQISQTDANGHTTTFGYDSLGRRTRRTLPLGMSESMDYDLAGNLVTKTDFNGKTTTFAYDNANRLVAKTPDPSLVEPTINFTYTVTGQRASMEDASGTTTYTYDSRDRLVAKATPEGSLFYTYNEGGNVTSIASDHANGVSMSYEYDAMGRLSLVIAHRLGDAVTTYAYDKVGNLTDYSYPNGVEHLYSYNALNRLTNLTVQKDSTALSSYAYTLGPTGNRLSVAELGGRLVQYTYDSLYRLTQETITADPNGVNGAIGYVYDPVGNRLTRTSTVAGIDNQSFSYDANDRITTESYDDNGNTLSTDGRTFSYDADNRLVGMNSGEVTMLYDGDGNRVAKTVEGVTTEYLVDTLNPTGYSQVLEEIENGTLQRVYTYGLDLISQDQTSGTSFYGYDGHGNVRILTGPTGAVTDRYDYDAFGVQLQSIGATPNDYRYTGEQNDLALGAYYLRARYLNPFSGRFLSLDVLRGVAFDPISLHKYLYVKNNPINNYDPSGLYTLTEMMMVSAISNIAATTIVNSYNALFQNRFPTTAEWLKELGIDVVTAPIGVLAGSIGGRTAGFFLKTAGPRMAFFFKAAASGVGSNVAVTLADDLLKWAFLNQPIEKQLTPGRYIRITFIGAAAGVFVADVTKFEAYNVQFVYQETRQVLIHIDDMVGAVTPAIGGLADLLVSLINE